MNKVILDLELEKVLKVAHQMRFYLENKYMIVMDYQIENILIH